MRNGRRGQERAGRRPLAVVVVVAAALLAAVAVPAAARTVLGRADAPAAAAAPATSSAPAAPATAPSGPTDPAADPAVAPAADPAEDPQPAPAEPTVPAATTAASTGCSRTASATPKVRITQVDVGVQVAGYGREGDTEPLPLAIAPRPGGSWLAFLGAGGRIHLAKLNCRDKLVGTVKSFAGVDLQDVHADKNGGVLLVTRKGACGPNTLCGGSPSPCYTMVMIRFDNAGAKVWERQVTNLTASRKGYTDGARFVWWYQHHGRLATDGKGNYAAYFGVAVTVRNGNCVDIHQGDRMQVVNRSGQLVRHQDSFEVGCSHSWGTRIVYDKRTGHFVMVCATDNNCRIAQPDPYRTVASGACDGTLFGGDLVPAAKEGYWTAWSQGGTARLSRFTTGAANKTVTTAARTDHPHLVRYASGRMLLTWESGASTVGQLYSAGAGTKIGAQFRIGVRDHAFQAWKRDGADGSVVYPAAGSTATTVRIARVLPLS